MEIYRTFDPNIGMNGCMLMSMLAGLSDITLLWPGNSGVCVTIDDGVTDDPPVTNVAGPNGEPLTVFAIGKPLNIRVLSNRSGPENDM